MNTSRGIVAVLGPEPDLDAIVRAARHALTLRGGQEERARLPEGAVALDVLDPALAVAPAALGAWSLRLTPVRGRAAVKATLEPQGELEDGEAEDVYEELSRALSRVRGVALVCEWAASEGWQRLTLLSDGVLLHEEEGHDLPPGEGPFARLCLALFEPPPERDPEAMVRRLEEKLQATPLLDLRLSEPHDAARLGQELTAQRRRHDALPADGAQGEAELLRRAITAGGASTATAEGPEGEPLAARSQPGEWAGMSTALWLLGACLALLVGTLALFAVLATRQG